MVAACQELGIGVAELSAAGAEHLRGLETHAGVKRASAQTWAMVMGTLQRAEAPDADDPFAGLAGAELSAGWQKQARRV